MLCFFACWLFLLLNIAILFFERLFYNINGFRVVDVTLALFEKLALKGKTGHYGIKGVKLRRHIGCKDFIS